MRRRLSDDALATLLELEQDARDLCDEWSDADVLAAERAAWAAMIEAVDDLHDAAEQLAEAAGDEGGGTAEFPW